MNAIQAPRYIAELGGNLPDESPTDRTGPNDAAHCGLMYAEARRLAREALAEQTKPGISQGVLAWVGGSWERANYYGPDRGSYAWDFGEWGLRDEDVKHWLPLPPPPESEPTVDKRFSLDLTRIGCGADGSAQVERLKALLNGKTFMNFKVIAAPVGGEIQVSIEGVAELQEAFTGMVLFVLAAELAKTAGAAQEVFHG